MKTNDISLRPIEITDLDVLHEWKNSKEIYKFLGGGYSPISKTEYESWVKSMCTQSSDSKRFIIQNENKTALGMAGLYSINLINRVGEIGLFIASKGERGNGIGGLAFSSLEEYAVKYLNLRKLKLFVVETNTIAVKFWVKQGFLIKGKLTEERYIEGEYHNVLIMEKFINGGSK